MMLLQLIEQTLTVIRLWWIRPQKGSVEDLLALARDVESEMPTLAAELRIVARHGPGAS